MVTNRLSIKSSPLGFRGLTLPLVLGALACSRALTPGPGHLLFGTWSSPAASLTAGPSRAGLVLPCFTVRLQPLRLDDSSRFEVTGVIASVDFSVPRHRGDPFPLSGQVVRPPPRRAVLAALASVSSVPVLIGLMIASGTTSFRLDPAQFFFGLVFPYLLVVGMAYVGARVVYQLGSEVKRARELGSYRLEEKLGEGGMGEVWRAQHRMLARPAAIKLIRPSFAADGRVGVSAEAVRRFEREAQVIARLRSPHTVELFDFGIAADGAFYYVMELLDGLDADSLLRRFGPTPPERAIYLLRQVCHSLSEAQSCGLVHRDIKPANIFLCRYGEEYDFVKVLDFGIVRAVRDSADTSPVHTRENAVQGTPAFIAPEQAMGTDLDGRADIYATGWVAYWLLTGQFVFTAETPMALLLQHAQTPPTPPSARTDLPIPTALDDLVLACLAKDPADRPQSARELSLQLAEVEGASAWTQDRAREWWATHQPVLT